MKRLHIVQLEIQDRSSGSCCGTRSQQQRRGRRRRRRRRRGGGRGRFGRRGEAGHSKAGLVAANVLRPELTQVQKAAPQDEPTGAQPTHGQRILQSDREEKEGLRRHGRKGQVRTGQVARCQDQGCGQVERRCCCLCFQNDAGQNGRRLRFIESIRRQDSTGGKNRQSRQRSAEIPKGRSESQSYSRASR